MNLRNRCALVAAILTGLVTSQCGAQDVPLTPYATGYLHSGEMRAVEVLDVGPDRYVWVAGDGGQIRYSDDPGPGGQWEFQATPFDVSQTLLDIRMVNPNEGWASGRGGHIIKTSDGGGTWEHLNAVSNGLYDIVGGAATVWSSDFVDPSSGTGEGFALGLWMFQKTDQGLNSAATDWNPVECYIRHEAAVNVHNGGSAPVIDHSSLEMYDVRIIHDSASDEWRGIAVGEIENGDDLPPGGVVFYTDSSLPESQNGTRWWAVRVFPNIPSMDNPKDIWEVEFDSYNGDPDNIRGYLVGGHGVDNGFVYSTDDGGQNWTREKFNQSGSSAELYGVAAMGDGNAMAVGYGGSVWARQPSTGDWEFRGVTLPPSNNTIADRITVPIAAVDASFGGAVIAGSFGLIRSTDDFGIVWDFYNHVYGDPTSSSLEVENRWRLEAIHFSSVNDGYAFGQHQTVVRTSDGGKTWRIVHGGIASGSAGTSLVAADFKTATQGVAASTNTGGGVPLLHYTNNGDDWLPATVPNLSNPIIEEVRFGTGAVYWACGTEKEMGTPRTCLILRSTDNGISWTRMPSPSEQTFIPRALTFLTGGRGFVVGYDGNGFPRGFRWRPQMLSWVDVSPVVTATTNTGTQRRALRDIDSAGTTYQAARVTAVGENGIAYQYNHFANPARFEDLGILSSQTELNLDSVDYSPSGEALMVGVEPWLGSTNAGDTLSIPPQNMGLLYVLDQTGINAYRSLTNDSLKDVQLLNDNQGVMLSRNPFPITEPELGTVADTGLFSFDRN